MLRVYPSTVPLISRAAIKDSQHEFYESDFLTGWRYWFQDPDMTGPTHTA